MISRFAALREWGRKHAGGNFDNIRKVGASLHPCVRALPDRLKKPTTQESDDE